MVAVTLVCAPTPRAVFEQTLSLPDGATLEEAVRASRIGEGWPALAWRDLAPGIWGRSAGWDQVLAEGDRVELCRPLLVDPKVARRERFQRQGSRGAGLFARRREGGKAGY
ncbi:RnfH family protein [Variovorax sp. ZT4R33]|uniref:RnfH family protein n=1 Tax=Variovorax sp. ZT4R33 TaxID=3443743 RepID=UPI003F44B858